jgi:hypothetical protein
MVNATMADLRTKWGPYALSIEDAATPKSLNLDSRPPCLVARTRRDPSPVSPQIRPPSAASNFSQLHSTLSHDLLRFCG